MWAYEIQDSFGLSSLKKVERTERQPGPGEVVVEIKAASLNFRDYLTVIGQYNPRQRLPLIPFSDGAGMVIARGPGAERFAVGARVVTHFAPGWISGEGTRAKFRTSLGGPADGTLTERMTLSEEGLVEMPAHLSFEEAATLPCAALTAFSALVTYGKIQPGDTVVVQGTGGVALFGLQFAKLCGARVIVTSSSDEKLERAHRLGADLGINYRAVPAWGEAVRELTGKLGADHIVELGGAGTLEQSLRAVRFSGVISLIGMLSGGSGPVNLIPVLMQNIRIQGITVGSRDSYEQMMRTIALHQLRPVVDQVFPVDQVTHALEALARGAHFGKICLKY